MSFALTTAQVLARSKTVTRRAGWQFLKPGDLVQAVEKTQGLKKGDHVRKLAVIRIVSVTREPLRRVCDDFAYGFEEVRKEGFAFHPAVCGSPDCFVDFYRNAQPAASRPALDDVVTRIEFEYV
jgi:hypothetical protein